MSEQVIDTLREAEAAALATLCRIQWSGIGVPGARVVGASGPGPSSRRLVKSCRR